MDDELDGLAGEDAELLMIVLERLTARREYAAAATPEPERAYATDGYSRALLM